MIFFKFIQTFTLGQESIQAYSTEESSQRFLCRIDLKVGVNMLVSLVNDSFIRIYDEIGYIYNQRSSKDLVYDKFGKFFLKFLTRKAQSVDSIVKLLQDVFVDTSYEELKRDFTAFACQLEIDGFVIIGNNEEEIISKIPKFSYSDSDSKTLPKLQYNFDLPYQETSKFLSDYFRNDPQIFSFQIELTSRCNEKCRHCYLPGSRDMHDLDTALVMDLMDQLAEMGTLGLTLSGGECLLHKNFIPILERAREKDFSISILSNVTLLNDELLRAIKIANIKLLQVSIYSMLPEEHDWITQLPGSLKKTLTSVEKLIAADIPVQISCPTMKKNYKSYKDVLKWAYDHNIKGYTDYIMMARIDNSTDNLECCRMTLPETRELLEDIIHSDIEYKALLDSSEQFIVPENLAEQPVCGAGCDSMCVAANGDFYPCSGFQGYFLGNAYEMSVADVWTKSDAIKKLRGIRWKDFPKCLKCEAKPFCAMCMSRNMNEERSILIPPKHFCDVAFLNKEIAEGYKQKVDGRTNEH